MGGHLSVIWKTSGQGSVVHGYSIVTGSRVWAGREDSEEAWELTERSGRFVLDVLMVWRVLGKIWARCQEWSISHHHYWRVLGKDLSKISGVVHQSSSLLEGSEEVWELTERSRWSISHHHYWRVLRRFGSWLRGRGRFVLGFLMVWRALGKYLSVDFHEISVTSREISERFGGDPWGFLRIYRRVHLGFGEVWASFLHEISQHFVRFLQHFSTISISFKHFRRFIVSFLSLFSLFSTIFHYFHHLDVTV